MKGVIPDALIKGCTFKPLSNNKFIFIYVYKKFIDVESLFLFIIYVKHTCQSLFCHGEHRSDHVTTSRTSTFFPAEKLCI